MDTYYLQNKIPDRDRFIANHWLYAECANDTHLFSKSGILRIHVRGNSGIWHRERIHFSPVFPFGIIDVKTKDPEKDWFYIEYWDPLVTLSAISNDGTAINAGWAVDNFGLDIEATYDKKIRYLIPMWTDIAVRDTDGYLLRIAYKITLPGKFVKAPPMINGPTPT